MAHLAAGARFPLAVKVKVRSRIRQDLAPGIRVASDQILHRDAGQDQAGVAERQSADRPDVIFELGAQRALDRPMAAIMYAPRVFIEDRAAR